MITPHELLAENLLKRRTLLEDALEEEDASWFDCERRREELVARVLVFEAGIGDPDAVRLVLDALPPYSAEVRFTPEDCAELALFLRNAILEG